MNEVLEVADSVNVLYLGQTAAQLRAKDTSRSEIIELITSGSAALAPAAAGPSAATASTTTDAPNGSTPA